LKQKALEFKSTYSPGCMARSFIPLPVTQDFTVSILNSSSCRK